MTGLVCRCGFTFSVLKVLQWDQSEHLTGHMIEDNTMIISCKPGYCQGGMKACQGHVRIDTKPEQINHAVCFSPATGTERKWEENRKME